MRLCIPTGSDCGLDAPIAAHFGSAPYFTLVDSESGAVQVVATYHAHHAHETCEPPTSLPAHGVGAVICLGLGRRAFASLQQLGIDVFLTDAGAAGGAVQAFRDGRVRAFASAAACQGGHRDGQQCHGGS
jgi:predicted Fe-Mo cluster-binding NifX family protein